MRRIRLIAKIQGTYAKCYNEGVDLDEEKLIGLLGSDEGVSRRTAKEYILCAKTRFQENLDISKQESNTVLTI